MDLSKGGLPRLRWPDLGARMPGQATGCRLRATGRVSPVAGRLSPVACRVLPVACCPLPAVLRGVVEDPRSDALVLFGASGDLAFKEIFPALQGLSVAGQLDIPVIGVARSEWSRDDFIARARASIDA